MHSASLGDGPVERFGGHEAMERRRLEGSVGQGTVNLSSPRAIFAGSPPRFTRSRVTYEAYVISADYRVVGSGQSLVASVGG